MTKSRGVALRKKGESLREQTHFLKALSVLDEAIILLTKEDHLSELVLALKDRSLTYLHLYNFSSAHPFLLLAAKDAEAMLELASSHHLPELALAHFTLGKVEVLRQQLQSALTHFRKALELYSGSLAERGDYRYHLGEAYYRLGKKKQGKQLLFAGLEEIRQGRGEVDPFLAHVWEARCLLIIIELLSPDSPAQVQPLVIELEDLFVQDKRLIILHKQWQLLKHRLVL